MIVPYRNETGRQELKNIKIANVGPIPTVLVSFCLKRAASVTAAISALFRTLRTSATSRDMQKDFTRMTSDVLEFNTVAGAKAARLW
jgi:hypothetical protein